MDIHKPKAAHSLREFLIEIGTIICGILIALGLEQSVEAIRHANEVRETREALARETEANVLRFKVLTDQIYYSIPVLQQDIEVLKYIRAHPGAPLSSWPGSIKGVVIRVLMIENAWQIAQHSQVLSLMPGGEVQRLRTLYGYCDQINDAQNQLIKLMYDFRTPFIAEPDAGKWSGEQLDHEIDLASQLVALYAIIANRQGNLADDFPQFNGRPDERASPTRVMHLDPVIPADRAHLEDVRKKLLESEAVAAGRTPAR